MLLVVSFNSDFIQYLSFYWGFPGGSDCKKTACNAGDLGLIPGLEWSPRGGHGYPLQYSCLENPHGQRNLAGYSPRSHKESDMTEGRGTRRQWNSKRPIQLDSKTIKPTILTLALISISDLRFQEFSFPKYDRNNSVHPIKFLWALNNMICDKVFM